MEPSSRSLRMVGARPAPAAPQPARFLLAGLAYLVVVACLVIGGTVYRGLTGGAASGLDAVMETRDLLALFGWVGLTISGVSLIILPNHWGVRFQPSWVPRFHWWVSNAGLAGFALCSLLGSVVSLSWAVPTALLSVVAGSYIVFASAVVRTFRRAVGPPGPTARAPRVGPAGIPSESGPTASP